MIKRAYISCDVNERDLEQVRNLCQFLYENGTIIEFAPDNRWNFYENIVAAIDRCDAFIAVFADGYRSSTWLTIELDYAEGLRRARSGISGFKKPRIFGVRVNGIEPPSYIKNTKYLEWIPEVKRDWGKILN